MNPIYLDYNATTPLDPAVREAMIASFDNFGNPSSTHALGQAANKAVTQARSQVAGLLGAEPDEIVFTGGGTEASNHAIKGVVFPRLQSMFGRWLRRPHIVVSAVEHPATTQPCAFLRRLGCKVTVIPVDRTGVLDLDAMRRVLKSGVTLVSVMHSNNEVGTLMPIREIAALTRPRGILLHTDAAQSLGKVPINVRELDVDLLTLAGHKLYAPKGVGVLYVRRGVQLEPCLHGAGHEHGRRAGTENVPYLVGLGQACERARQELPVATERLRQLRDRLWNQLHDILGERIVLNGHPQQRLPNTLNVNFVGHIGAELLAKTPVVAASTGSACHEGQVHLSPVLCAMHVPPDVGRGAVRLTVGRFTTDAEIDEAAAALVRTARMDS